MTKGKSVFVALIFLTTYSIGQVSITEYVSKDEPALFNTEAYNEIITRQNSCTFYLNEFMFNVTKQDKFIVDLQIKLNTYNMNSASPEKVRVLRLLFKDVIEVKEKDKPYSLSLSNAKLADNIVMTDVTDIDVDVRLIPIIDENNSSFKLIAPILNTIFEGSSPVTNLIDNFISSVKKGDNIDILVFHTNIIVPQNIFEYKKIGREGKINLISNNQVLGIILKGSNEGPFSNSLIGDGANFVNGITKFVSGKDVIKKSEVSYEGILKVYFTKDPNPLLPTSMTNQLATINQLHNGVNYKENYDNYKVKMKEISSAAFMSKLDHKINSQTEYSINQFLKLGEIYMDYQNKSFENPLNLTDVWVNKFRAFDIDINNKGAANFVQAIGVTDIYDGKIAKIYIPYTLADEIALSFYSWQLILHNVLLQLNDKTLAKSKPASISPTANVKGK